MYRTFMLLAAAIATSFTSRADELRASTSEGNGMRAELAADGDPGSRWSSKFADDQWIEMDFGEPRALTGVTLHWENAFGKRYDIQVPGDGAAWTTVYRVEDGDGGIDDLRFPLCTTRVLRVACRTRGTPWGFSLWEMVPRGAGDELRLAASSGNARAALDGDADTAWRSAADDVSPSLEVSLDAGIVASGLDLVWGEAVPERYTLETSDDGTAWIRVYEGVSVRPGRVRCPVVLGGARRLRVACSERPGRSCELAEIRLWSWDEGSTVAALDKVRGVVGAENYPWVTFVGRDGTFAPEPQPYQAGFWLTVQGALYAPEMLETVWTLEDGRMPVSVVRWRADGVDVAQKTFARRVEGLDRLITFSRLTLHNRGTSDVSAAAHLILRANPLAEKWNTRLQELSLDGAATVSVNGAPALFLKTPPSSGVAGEAGVIRASRGQALTAGETVRIASGVRGGVISFACPLAAGASQSIELLALAGENVPVEEGLLALNVEDELAATTKEWLDRVPLRVDLPDRRYTDAFYASLNYLLILMKNGRPYPGPYSYKSYFLHDAIEMNAALDVAGLHDVAEKATDAFRYSEGGGYLDELGGSIFGLYEHARMTRDLEYLERVYPRMLKGCELARTLRARQTGKEFEGTPYFGLMPKSVSQDNFSIPAYLYVDNWWALLGLKATAEAAASIGKVEDAAWLKREYDALLRATLESIRAVMKRDGLDAMPAFADDWPDDQEKVDAEHRILGDTQRAWAHRPALYPGRSMGVALPEDLFARSYRKFWERAGRFSHYDGGWYVEYEQLFWGYNVQLAMPPMYVGMEDVALKSIAWSLDHQACPGGWAEGYVTCDGARGTREVCPGPLVGDVPHGWVAAYYVLLLRNMLMREEDGALLLLPCIPETWLARGERIGLKKAPTYFGSIDWTAECLNKGELRVALKMEQPPPRGYIVCLPAVLRVTGAQLGNGRDADVRGNRVHLPPGTTEALIRFR